jgi:hypothetical protein
MVFPHFLLVWLLLETVCRTSALHVGVRGKPRSPFTAKRDHISSLENSWNLDYVVNVTMGGQLLQVLIDTGRCIKLFGRPIIYAMLTRLY